MADYPLIADHGLIGDLQTAALVTTDGSIDWFCAPRFDSGSIFGALLDHRRGGHFRVRPTAETFTRKQLYFPDTAILVTRYMTEAGVGEVVDFMPVSSSTVATNSHRIVRMLRCVRGQMTFELDLAPRFDYGRERHETRLTEAGAVFKGPRTAMTVHLVREPEDGQLAQIRVDDDGDVHAELTLMAGQMRGLVVETGTEGPPRQLRVAEVRNLFDETVAFWRRWLAQSSYTGRWREALHRSAITLKLMTYAPSGGLVAAPTAALPEQVGGERNWDYRYTWIRDGTLTLISLFSLGIREEAEAFKFWMERTSAGRCEDLQIMYGISGERRLPELELGHLSGHRGSRPVRIGNGAAKQKQLDCYGQLVESAYLFSKAGGRITPDNWNFLAEIANTVSRVWREPDHGIWEIRDEPRHFVHSKLNCWAALDRAVKIAHARKLPSDTARWTKERDAVREYLLEDARARGWFSQAAGSDAADASALLVPAMGFLPTTDPLVQETIEQVRAQLAHGSLVHRYVADDGLSGGEGAFLLCSYWLLDCLTFSGRIAEAEQVLEDLESYNNDVGLWAEEVDERSGEALGNFPQAFTHMAHITSCLHLEAARDGEIDYDAAHDYAEHAVDRLLATGRQLAALPGATR
jgi:GH15 family glucan-1,4-alpha-glucosidase